MPSWVFWNKVFLGSNWAVNSLFSKLIVTAMEGLPQLHRLRSSQIHSIWSWNIHFIPTFFLLESWNIHLYRSLYFNRTLVVVVCNQSIYFNRICTFLDFFLFYVFSFKIARLHLSLKLVCCLPILTRGKKNKLKMIKKGFQHDLGHLSLSLTDTLPCMQHFL